MFPLSQEFVVISYFFFIALKIELKLVAIFIQINFRTDAICRNGGQNRDRPADSGGSHARLRLFAVQRQKARLVSTTDY
jgi:hypothetical protein